MADSELVVEEEPHYDKNEIESRQKSALFEHSSGDDADDEDLEQSDLNAITGAAAETVTTDEVCMQFYDRINSIPNVNTQCLRYLRWPTAKVCQETNTPLWIRSDFQPGRDSTSGEERDDRSGRIPPCEKCGAPRKFEFQLMPQMIHYLLKKRNADILEARKTTDDSSKDDPHDTAAALEALRTATAIMDETPPEQIPPDLAATKEKAAENMRKKLMGSTGSWDRCEPGWGVVAVYTCTASCGGDVAKEEIEQEQKQQQIENGVENDDSLSAAQLLQEDFGAYIEEFAWRQPSLD
jgi:pre-rRNA-processing protein TSR4